MLLILLLAHIIGSLCCIPGSLFGISTGIVFNLYFKGDLKGYFLSVLYFFFIAVVSGLIVFNFSKKCFYNFIQDKIIYNHPTLMGLNRILHVYGTKAIFVLRLSPLVPIYFLNYILGGFDSKFCFFKLLVDNKIYIISAFGSLPAEFLICYVGYNALNVEQLINSHSQYKYLYIGALIFGAVVILIFVMLLVSYAKKEFNKLIEMDDKEQNPEKSS